MLAHSIKPILKLIPEAADFIKQASVDQEYPLDSRDSAIASALELKYHEHVDHRSVDVFAMDKVAQAVKLFGAADIVNDLSGKMIKAARQASLAKMQNPSEDFLRKQAGFEGAQTGFVDIPFIASEAVAMYKQALELGVEPSDTVKRYSGHGLLDKKAAVEGLASRYQATGNVNFVKLASALGRMDTLNLKPETVFDVAITISQRDKEAGISAQGYNFFNEAVMTKSAASAMQVTLMNKPYAYEDIQRLGSSRIGQYLGEDVGKEIDKDPYTAKATLEALPMDLQKILCNLLGNC